MPCTANEWTPIQLQIVAPSEYSGIEQPYYLAYYAFEDGNNGFMCFMSKS